MRRILGALGALAIVISGGAAAGAAVGGEVDETPADMTIDPTSGEPGTVITVEGTGCTSGDAGDMSVEISAEGTVEGTKVAFPSETGAWSTTLTVADGVDPGTVIDVDADCIETFGEAAPNSFQGVRAPVGNGQVLRFSYPTAQFTVTATPTTTTTTVDDTTTTTEAPAEVDATAAEPTVAQPTFTG